MNKPLILVVEDDLPVHNLIVTTLKAHAYRYLSARDGETAILEATSHNPDIILARSGTARFGWRGDYQASACLVKCADHRYQRSQRGSG